MANTSAPNGPQGYNPLEDPTYMSPDMRSFFKTRLNSILEKIITEEKDIRLDMVDYPASVPDNVDLGKLEEIKSQEFLDLEHEGELRREVEDALQRIEAGTYGYCQETGKPIGVKRLLAYPMARYIISIQQNKENL